MSRLPEQKAWDNFSKSIDGSRLTFHRVENLIGNGMPDVVAVNENAITFWVENKAITDWPARFSTKPLASGVFEPGQLGWARAWKWKGGRSYVLLRVESEIKGAVGKPRKDVEPPFCFYLLDPVNKIEEMTRGELIFSAVAKGKPEILEYMYSIKYGAK